MVTVREASALDVPFLEEMLHEAFFWSGEAGRLRSMIALARQRSWPALSLSVAPANPARRLYESEGFRKVAEAGTSWTMLLPLP